MSPEKAAHKVQKLVDQLGKDMSLGTYVEFLEEILADVQIKFDAARHDQERQERG